MILPSTHETMPSSASTLRLFQIDAFASEVFRGNPAAVCQLDHWLDADVLQDIAAENNLAETAFLVPEGTDYRIRWFTPRFEVPLCGHATLAAGFVVFRHLAPQRSEVRFASRSGPLGVTREGDLLTLDFPLFALEPCSAPPADLLMGLGQPPREVMSMVGDPNYLALYDSEAAISALSPDLTRLARLHPHGVAVSARGEHSDCASRYFAPSYGIPEDPVTGSIHCAIAPYWARRLGTSKIHARQVSQRGGDLYCEVGDTRVRLSGRAVQYLEGRIAI